MIKNILKSRTAQNAGWLMGGRIAQMLINLLVGLLTARYLGPANYGLISYAAAYTTFFTSLCNLGLNSILVKEFVDRKGEEGTIVGTALALRAGSGLLSALAIWGIVSIVDDGDPTAVWVVALSSIGLVLHAFEVIGFWFQSKLRSKVTAIVSLIAYTATALYKLFLLATGKTVVWFALATSVDYLLIGLLLVAAYGKHRGGKLVFSWSYAKRLLKEGCHFILPGMMVAVYTQTDRIMLKHMMGEAELGYYATAVSLCGVWCFVLTAIIDSVVPTIMSAHQSDKALYIKRNKQLYCMVFYISTAVSIVLTLLAEVILLILYGEAYLPAAGALRIITWYTAFSYLGVARDAWVVCEQRQKYLIFVYAAAAVLNALLNALLIPLWGAEGAALASLVAQVMTVMVVPCFIKNLRENAKLMWEAVTFQGLR